MNIKNKMFLYFLIPAFLSCNLILAQENTNILSDKEQKSVDTWISKLYEVEANLKKDSILVNDEIIRLHRDAEYRKIIYPEIYTWTDALYFVETKQLSVAFWYFINLYKLNEKNKELVVKSFITYNQLLDMEKVLISTFYTYCITDPKIMDNEKQEIKAPHILEEKLDIVNEIIFFVKEYQRNNPKKIKEDYK